MKHCTSCKRLLNDAEFRPDPRLISGLASACRPCLNKRAALQRKKPEQRIRIRKYMLKWLALNKVKNSKIHLKWIRANSLRCKAHSCNNIAKRRFGVCPISTDTLVGIFNNNDCKCEYCGSSKSVGFDHRVPMYLGGEHHASNLVVCCATCNRMKSKLTEERFRAKCAQLGRPLLPL